MSHLNLEYAPKEGEMSSNETQYTQKFVEIKIREFKKVTIRPQHATLVLPQSGAETRIQITP